MSDYDHIDLLIDTDPIELGRRYRRVRAALEDAIDGMEDMIVYVPDYFSEKWGHDEFLARARTALDNPTAGEAPAPS